MDSSRITNHTIIHNIYSGTNVVIHSKNLNIAYINNKKKEIIDNKNKLNFEYYIKEYACYSQIAFIKRT